MIPKAIEQKESRIYEDELYRQPRNAASYQFSLYKEQARPAPHADGIRGTMLNARKGDAARVLGGCRGDSEDVLSGSPSWWEPISPQRLGLARGQACQAQTANQQRGHPVCALANTRVDYWFPNEVRVAEET